MKQLLLLLVGFAVGCGTLPDDEPIRSDTKLPENASQLIIVTTSGWNAVAGELRRLEKTGDKWAEIDRWPIVVGRNGLAWGKGIHPQQSANPQKQEGDGKSPAGIFHLSSAFGSESRTNLPNLKLPYLPLTSVIECVDDAESQYYNTIVRRDRVPEPDWKSSEKMLSYGEQYRLGVVVDHNMNPRRNGDGSCIFLHIWKSDRTGTAGCTAMAADQMKTLIEWLDAEKRPFLIQLTKPEYRRLQADWKLPRLQ